MGYSFGATSATEIGHELEFSLSATFGTENKNVAASASITAWATHSWENNWSREGSESYDTTRLKDDFKLVLGIQKTWY